jgi:hypothetical protein
MAIEILDVDIEFVRKALEGASEAAKGWFETLVDQHADFRNRVESLTEMNTAQVTKIKELEHERDDLKDSLESEDADNAARILEMEGALLAVREWLDRVMLHHLPMTDPRRLLRTVEAAL